MTVSTSAISAQTIFKRALVDEDIFSAMMENHVKVRLNCGIVSEALLFALGTLTLFDRLARVINFIAVSVCNSTYNASKALTSNCTASYFVHVHFCFLQIRMNVQRMKTCVIRNATTQKEATCVHV